ncbi:oligogalacturonate lyase family protein [Uliginosibacterium sp. 31-16]|uniref:oligogalacturonate lyase family protein n=1 Tax=Uliginosibacterium sp. 31-16 TaxID=3068315 RepID=UPI00273DBF5A|nr:oligogalacturonate lyase family protein [Uliginosibacterium sp. 31-16]MDP5239752.1 oligogalacturonate lyase family protein [Uliginosibacterium sp. 31-16]
MAKGSTIQFEYLETTDPDTGVRVTRLSPPDVACPRNYFYQKCFTDDGSKLLFGGEFEDVFNIWLLDLPSGVARQITEGKGDNYHGAYLSPDEKSIFYTKGGREHRRVDLATLAESVIYTVPEGWKGAGTWVPNSDCTRIAGMEMLAADQVTASSGWERFRKQFEANPRERLIDIDIATGQARVVLDQQRYMGHPMFRPFDDSIMGFCHEGPHDLVDARMWFINADGTALRRVKEHAPHESCMHEFWVPDGSKLMYVSYTKGDQDRFIWAADPVTLANENIMAMPPCAHLMSNFNGSLVVGDGAGQLGDVADKDGHAFEADPYIHLFDITRRTHRKVCRHDSSWAEYKGNTQATHPHPSFTPDEKRVLFSSDRDGKPALYLADLPA